MTYIVKINYRTYTFSDKHEANEFAKLFDGEIIETK